MSSEEIIDSALARYERVLISFARAITGDPESARDAVQETFLRLSRQGFVGPRVALDTRSGHESDSGGASWKPEGSTTGAKASNALTDSRDEDQAE